MDVVPQLETCRICAKCYLSSRPAEFLHLFGENEGKHGELDFIRKEINCWQLEISANDGLPQHICSNCFQKFCTIANFRRECLVAQELLQKARLMTEKQNQQKNESSTQEKPQTAILLPATFVLTNAHPIMQKLDDAVSFSVTAGVSQKKENLQPQIIEAKNILEENILIDVVNDEDAVENNVATSTHCQHQMSNVDNQYEQINVEVIAQEADTTTQSSTEDFPKHQNNSNDFEEVLEGSIIPKNLKKLLIDTDLPLEGLIDDPIEESIPQRIASYPHACNYCYCPPKGPIDHLVFATSEELSQHFFDVHDPKLPYPCPKCPKLFASMANRNKHFHALHGATSKPINFCTFCNKKIQVPQDAHEKNCTFIADWHCETCESDFFQMPLHSFRAHQRSHVECHFRCDICNLMFSQLTLLHIHKRSHEKPNAFLNRDEFKCKACNQVFGSMYDLKCHELARHNASAAFRCKFCSKGYSTLAFLRRHIENAHTNRANHFGQNVATCPKCNATFQSKSKLHHHIQRTKYENGRCIPIRITSNVGLKAFACEQCFRYFNSKEQLEIHQETHDIQLRPYPCKKCNIRCRTAIDLKEHDKMMHTKLKTLKCEICAEKFAYHKDLETHKLYHAKLEFPCTFKDCKTSCKDEQALKEHKRVHDPVTCEFCGGIFASNDIEAHIKKTHNNNNNEENNSNFKNVLTKPISDVSFNQNHLFENYADHPISVLQQSSTLTLNQNANDCAPYVGSMDTHLLDDGIIFGEENDTIANNVDFIMSEENLVHDSFISSLLDPDYEIVAN